MILVTGGTGMNGTALLQRLSARGVPALALVRNPQKAGAIAALPGIEVAAGDLSRPETLSVPLNGITSAFLTSTSDATMQEVQTNFIEAARKAGVKHVVKLSGIIADVRSPFRFARMHGEIEKRLEESGMAFTHLRAGEFMQSYFRQVPTIVQDGALYLPMENARIASIDVGDIAEAAAAILTGSGHHGKVYRLTGSESLTMSDVAERLSRVTGRPVKYVNVPPEAFKKTLLATGAPAYRADALGELFTERRKGMEATVHPTLRSVFKIEPTTLEQFFTRHAAIFKGKQPPPKG
jgi:uncharacterized protein YbjT (DUF2867 family)